MKKRILCLALICIGFIATSYGAKFSLYTEKQATVLGCPFEVQIIVDTQNKEITAADMNLFYNEDLFDVKGFVPGSAFDLNWGLKQDKNMLRSTAISYPEGFSGLGLFAMLTLMPKLTSQETHIDFNIDGFERSDTLQSNLAFNGEEYLEKTKNLKLSIQTGICDVQLKTEGFVEFDDDLSFEEFNSKRKRKVSNQGNLWLPNSFIEDGINREILDTLKKYSYWIILALVLIILIMIFANKKRRHKRDKNNNGPTKTYNITIKSLIVLCLSLLLGTSSLFASELFFSPDSGEIPMFCSSSVDVKVSNPDSPISSIDMIMKFSSGDVENYNFVVPSSEYNSPIFNQYVWNTDILSDTRKFGGTRLTDRSQNASIKHVGTFSFNNISGIMSTDFGFHAIDGQSAGDSNLGYNSNDQLTSTGSASFDFVFAPCSPDTKAPEIPSSFRTIGNGANRVNLTSNFDFRIIDQNIGHQVDYWFQSNPLILANYVSAPVGMDNQYGVDSGTITVTIQGKDYTDNYTLSDFSSTVSTGITRNRNERGYDITLNPTRDFRIEEAITINMEGYDNTDSYKTNAYRGIRSLTFNSPQKPYVVRSSLANRSPSSDVFVSPDLNLIRFRTEDSWAGVDSGSLVVTIMTGTASSANGGVLGIFSGTDLSLSGINKIFASNGILGSQSIAHDNNYDISLSNFGSLPENSYIWVITSGLDLAPFPNAFAPSNDRFVFQTRQSCNALQCGEGVTIYTGNIHAGTEALYLHTGLTVSGGSNPYISGNQLFCNETIYHSIDLYENGTQISYGASTGGTIFFTGFSSETMTIDVRGGTAQIFGNTVYFIPTPPQCGNGVLNSGEQCDDGNTNNNDGCNASCITEGGGGGGGSHTTRDNCQLPSSSLPGANREGIDYSPSYYDQTCLAEGLHDAPPECTLLTDYDGELMDAYIYACELNLMGNYSLEEVGMLEAITRIETAHMLSEFAVKVFGKTPDADKNCTFNDMYSSTNTEQAYAQMACKLGIMGLEYDGSPASIFNPEGKLTRAEFGTIFSRLIYGEEHNGNADCRYCNHLEALKADNIMTKIEDPDMIEQKGYVMLMLQRTDTSNLVNKDSYENLNTGDVDYICSLTPYGEELEQAYLFACGEEITSAKTIEDADMYGTLKRKHLAKMITIFATKVLGRSPDRTRACSYLDVADESYEMQYYMQAACELGLMGLEYDGAPARHFMPDKFVSRAEFGTVFSRLLFGGLYNGNADCRYCWHLERLKKDGIMTNTTNSEENIELRGYVMLMMERAQALLK